MQPERSLFRIARKELTLFFSSPVAFVFLASFLAVNLFVFFWVESFFSRNIADVRPLFEWMPILLIFLVAAITMRLWSEEKRQGTIEFLMTLPVSTIQFVLGKFLACMFLLVLALVLTLPVPISVAIMADLDWGPVVGAYVATLFLGAAYTSIGLYVSARTESQIVSLMVTVLIGMALYLVGSGLLTSLTSVEMAEFLKKLGTGSRFDSITRGVIDVRDLYYYLSILGIFLTLNILALERQRWAKDGNRQHHRGWYAVAGLFIANFVAANLWLNPLHSLRADLTRGQMYSISDTTRDSLQQLQEPLLIRGYFSAKTHPLLAPLPPQLRDLIREYEIAGRGKVRVEFVDPQLNPELEDEANTKYGIRPVPFQVSDKYQASLVNSYFHVLIQYGDEFEVLGFEDLIEVKERNQMELDVKLRNPEYDITRSIRKVLHGFQSSGDLFATLNKPVQFTGYISADDRLPKELADLRQELEQVLSEMRAQSNGNFSYEIQDPQAGDGELAQTILENYGLQPMMTSLLSRDSFYFYLMLSDAQQTVQVAIPESLDQDGLKRNLEAGLKRFSSGFTKTVALVAPQPNLHLRQFGGQLDKSFNLLEQKLAENMTVLHTDLKDGQVPAQADLLVVVAPENLDEKQLFAIDQFLMKGGTVLLSTSPFTTEMTRTSLTGRQQTTGLEQWLEHHGLALENSMVLDPQNARFPVPVTRTVGSFRFQELQLLDYPYFADIRGSGLNQDNPITSGLPQVTINWASPIRLDEEKHNNRQVTKLLHSSANSWLSDTTEIVPRVTESGNTGFRPEGEQGSHLLGVLVEGKFDSYFAGQSSPLLEEGSEDAENSEDAGAPSSVIQRSSDSARIILFSSSDFLTDQTLNMTSAADRSLYLNSLQLVQNAVEWSLEDRGLLHIRSRSHFANTLPPLTPEEQQFWEYLNYALVVIGLLIVWGVYRAFKNAAQKRYLAMLNLKGA